MKLKAFSETMLTLLFLSMLTLTFTIKPFRAGGNIYVRTDRSVAQPTTPVSTVNNIEYESTPDVAVLGAGPARMRIPDPYFGTVMPVVAVVKNNGTQTETFDVSIYRDTTLIGTSTVTLNAGDTTTVSFSWDLGALPVGAYTIKASATAVQGETDTANNNFVNGEVRKTFDCDVNADGIVDASDLFDLSKAYESTTLLGDINSDGIVDWIDYGLIDIAFLSTEGMPNYNPYADMDKNGYVGSADAAIFQGMFGMSTSFLNWNPYADMNADNEVDASDLFNLSKNYGNTYP